VLDERALVLNRSWTPISTTSVRRALVLIVRGAAGVVHPETYRVHSWDEWVQDSAAPVEVAGPGADGLLDGDGSGTFGADGDPASGAEADAQEVAVAEAREAPRLRGFGIYVRVPEVIALRHYDGYPVRGVAFTRRNVYRRDSFSCQWCGRRPGVDELTIDHVIPRSRGGTSTWENCVTACRSCNARKANRLAHELDLALHKAPVAPRWPGGLDPASVRARPAWHRFLPASALAVGA